MKNKFLATIIIAALAASLVACGGDAETAASTEEAVTEADTEAIDETGTETEVAAEEEVTEETEEENPIEELDSLEELNEKIGANLKQPGVMGVTDESFQIFHANTYDMAIYEFSVNGISYSLHYAVTDIDISGVYTDTGSIFDNSDELYYEDEECKAARYFDGDAQYSLVTYDNGTMEMDTFEGIATELFTVCTMQ